MVLPGDPAIDRFGAGECLYHYNILRPIHFVSSAHRHAVIPRLRARLGRSPAAPDWERLWPAWRYDSDPEWTRLATASSLPKRALVLVAPRSVLIERASERAAVEPTRHGDDPYDREHWLQILATVDLVGLYRAWCAELSARGIAWRLIDSSGDEYPEIPQEGLSDLLGRRPDVIGAA